MTNYMQKINTVTQPIPEILAIYFEALWACPCMPDHTQQELHDQPVASMDI